MEGGSETRRSMTLDAISGPPMAGESATLSQIIGFVPYGKAEEEEEEGLRHLFLERANDKLFYGRGGVIFYFGSVSVSSVIYSSGILFVRGFVCDIDYSSFMNHEEEWGKNRERNEENRSYEEIDGKRGGGEIREK